MDTSINTQICGRVNNMQIGVAYSMSIFDRSKGAISNAEAVKIPSSIVKNQGYRKSIPADLFNRFKHSRTIYLIFESLIGNSCFLTIVPL